MRVLILTVTAGYGHNSTARAISERFAAMGAETVTEDMYLCAGRLMYKIVDGVYNFSIKHLRRSYEKTYTRLENGKPHKIYAELMSMRHLMRRKLAGYFKNESYDAVICTHVFAAMTMSDLKKRGEFTAPVLGICTDYCFQPFWEETENIDGIITAGQSVNCSAEKRGTAPERLYAFGLPVTENFLHRTDKRGARSCLGLDTDAETVLVMGGSMGYGSMRETVAKLAEYDESIQVVCICGNNKALLNELKSTGGGGKIVPLGFTDNVEAYMDAADCLITKPGGLTVTEALAKRVPMILTEPIPGHEVRNAEFLVNSGAALRIGAGFTLPAALEAVLHDSERAEYMRRMETRIFRPDAAEKLCGLAAELAGKKHNSEK